MVSVEVNKSTDPVQLKILYPSIKLALDGVPAYGKIVYRNFLYPLSEKTELLLEQSSAGFNLDSHLGLLGFMREVDYMPEAKLKRFEAAGRDRVIDSSGRVVTSEGIFHRNSNVFDMYFYCSTLRIANRVFIDEGIDVGYLLDVLESSLYRRLIEADRLGHSKMLERALQLLDSFYSSDMKFSAKRSSKGLSGFDRMAQIINTFDMQGFKNFVLTGDFKEDTYTFLSFFG